MKKFSEEESITLAEMAKNHRYSRFKKRTKGMLALNTGMSQ